MMALRPPPLSWQLLPLLLISRLSALPNLELPLLLSPLLILNLYPYHSMMALKPLPLPLCLPPLILLPPWQLLPLLLIGRLLALPNLELPLLLFPLFILHQGAHLFPHSILNLEAHLFSLLLNLQIHMLLFLPFILNLDS